MNNNKLYLQMNILIIISILILYLQICDAIEFPQKIGSKFSNESIILEYNLYGPYYSNWIFSNKKYNLTFNCIPNSNTRSCTAIINKENSKKLFGKINGCIINPIDGIEDCKFPLLENDYPIPIVVPEFKPTTKPGLVSLQGYYLKFDPNDYFTISPDVEIFYNNPLLDPTNIQLNYDGGCGSRTFLWSNNQNYTFNHLNPSITNVSINGSVIGIIGSNFCNDENLVSVIIDGKQIDKSNIKSIDHEIIEINYQELNSKKVNVKIIAGGLVSNEFQILFKPLPLKINSVPKNKRGYITIVGDRLSSNITNSKTIVKIGNSQCTNIISTQNQITCEIQPNNSITVTSNLSVIISIDGIENENTLLFSYGIPFISNEYTLPQGILHLHGDCLGNNSTTLTFIDGKQQDNITINIDENEKTMSFQLPLKSLQVSVSISINGVSSNVLLVDASFYATVSESSPSINGQLVEYTLTNINQPNYYLIPTITILPENIIIKGTKVTKTKSIDLSIQTYSFEILKGCGKKRIIISIGNQQSPSEFSYEIPKITSCILGSNETIFCSGTFNNFTNYFNNSQLQIKFSDQIITNNEINWNNNSLSFSSKPSFGTSELFVELCQLQSSPLMVNITPYFEKRSFTLNPTFNSTGGVILINGKNFNDNSAQNTFFECLVNNTNVRFNCSLETYSSISCGIPLNGPTDKYCNFTFDGIKQIGESHIIISYYPPKIINSINQINYFFGGIITISGEEFYESIDSISIDNRICKNIKFISSNLIQCYLEQINEYIKTQDNGQFVNITINGKSNGKYLNIYSPYTPTHKPDSFENSKTQNDNDSPKKKKYTLLAILVLVPFIVIGLVFAIYKIRKYQLEKKETKRIRKDMKDLDESFVRTPNPPPETPLPPQQPPRQKEGWLRSKINK